MRRGNANFTNALTIAKETPYNNVRIPCASPLMNKWLCFRGCVSTALPVLSFEKFELRHVGTGKKPRDVFVRWIPQQPSSLLVFQKGPRGEVDIRTGEVRTGSTPVCSLAIRNGRRAPRIGTKYCDLGRQQGSTHHGCYTLWCATSCRPC